jgi:hypothetical protein
MVVTIKSFNIDDEFTFWFDVSSQINILFSSLADRGEITSIKLAPNGRTVAVQRCVNSVISSSKTIDVSLNFRFRTTSICPN